MKILNNLTRFCNRMIPVLRYVELVISIAYMLTNMLA